MYYYTINRIGNGTGDDPHRPDVEGSYIWGASNPCSHCNTYLIATNIPIEGKKEITNLEDSCHTRGLDYEVVSKWWVSN